MVSNFVMIFERFRNQIISSVGKLLEVSFDPGLVISVSWHLSLHEMKRNEMTRTLLTPVRMSHSPFLHYGTPVTSGKQPKLPTKKDSDPIPAGITMTVQNGRNLV